MILCCVGASLCAGPAMGSLSYEQQAAHRALRLAGAVEMHQVKFGGECPSVDELVASGAWRSKPREQAEITCSPEVRVRVTLTSSEGCSRKTYSAEA